MPRDFSNLSKATQVGGEWNPEQTQNMGSTMLATLLGFVQKVWVSSQVGQEPPIREIDLSLGGFLLILEKFLEKRFHSTQALMYLNFTLLKYKQCLLMKQAISNDSKEMPLVCPASLSSHWASTQLQVPPVLSSQQQVSSQATCTGNQVAWVTSRSSLPQELQLILLTSQCFSIPLL